MLETRLGEGKYNAEAVAVNVNFNVVLESEQGYSITIRAGARIQEIKSLTCRKYGTRVGRSTYLHCYQALMPTANATQGMKLVPPLMVATTSVAAMEFIESSTRIDFSGEGCSVKPLCGGVIWVWEAAITTR